ncbi:4-hydroxylaminobenzoate lyase [Azospirillum sp. ST 5-10]|uniref:4-hydroxylaminobenzoate lyase n=1 Tax=unclassified Azospirillum TaxID=2630922 RepID=UPI003F4A2E06
MSKDAFKTLVRSVTDRIAGRPLDGGLETFLNETFPPDGRTFQDIEAMCRQGADEGWMCEREHGGIRFGRVLAADPELAGFSVDVVRMADVEGPHHRHPDGEIDMVMPITPDARFDGTPRGWKVYGPDSAHRPTVSEGAAYVLYLLPGGKIEFTR